MGTEICRLGGYGFRGTVTVSDGSNQTGGGMEAGYVNAGKKEKAAEKSGTQRERIQLEPSGTSCLCLGITRHSCDTPHALIDVAFITS